MMTYFRSFSQKFPRLNNLAENSLIFIGGTAVSVAVTNRIEDPVRRKIAWKNFLDVDGYKADLAKHQALQRKTNKTKPK